MPQPLAPAHRIDTPEGRARALAHVWWRDHGFLRRHWTNFAPVAPDVFRSNHPDLKRLTQLRDRGITTILSLRGAALSPPQMIEAADCAALGLTLHTVALQARAPAPRAELQRMFHLFRTMDRPFLMHCKSGADRAGFAAALYQIGIEGRPVAEVRRQLSLRFLHVRWSRTGILDHILDLFEQDQRQTGIGIEDWIATRYDPATIAAGWRR
jgi:protein tyrosine/serine phosphatase